MSLFAQALPHLRPESKRYPWFVLAAVCLATFMGAMDTSVVNAAFPTLADTFDVTITVVGWVGIAYLVTSVTFLTIAGRLADIIGNRPIFLAGYAVFLVGTVLSGVSPSVSWLIGARVVSAIGMAMLTANSIALIGASFPSNRIGTAVAIIETTVAVALASGPIVGGFFTEWVSWRSIFFISYPVGLAGLLLGVAVIRDPPRRKKRESFDFLGAVLFSGGMVSLLLGLTNGSTLGWESPYVLVAFGLAIAMLGAFVVVEQRVPYPMIALGLFGNPVFAAANLAKVCCYLCMFTASFLAPFYFQRILGFGPAEIGLGLTPMPAALLLSSLTMGPLSDRIGPRIIMPAGMLVGALGCLLLANLGPEGGYPAAGVALLVLVLGLGSFIAPNDSVIIGSAPREKLGVASGLLAVARNLGMILGVALAGALLASRLGVYLASGLAESSAFVAAFQDVARASAVIALIGAAASLVYRPGRETERHGRAGH